MDAWETTLDDAMALVEYWSHTPTLRDLVSVIAQSEFIGWQPSSRPVEGGNIPVEDIPPEFEE